MAAPRTASRDSKRPITAAGLRKQLRADASAEDARILQRFFKTAPGEVRRGRRLPRRARAGDAADSVASAVTPSRSPRSPGWPRSRVHEDRSLALMLLVRAFEQADDRGRRENLRSLPCQHGVDQQLGSRRPVGRPDRRGLAARPQSCAAARARTIVVTLGAPDRDRCDASLHPSQRPRGDVQDRRPADARPARPDSQGGGLDAARGGKRDGAALRAYLRDRYRTMPRTMLRYAIERFPEAERRRYLKGSV